jgi:hypothetical protein
VKVTGTLIPVKAAGMTMLLSAIDPTNLLLTVVTERRLRRPADRPRITQ